MAHSWVPLIAALTFGYVVAFSAELSAQIVNIRLRKPVVATTNKTVRIEDVAELTGGNSSLRRRMAALDLDEFDERRTPIEVTAERIRYRILLEGIPDDQFRLGEHEATTVRWGPPLNFHRLIEMALTEQAAEFYALAPDSMEIQILAPLDQALQRLGIDPATLRATAQFPAELPIGQRSIEVTIADDRGTAHTFNVSVKFIIYRDVVMLKENVSRGEVLDENKIERVRRPIDDPQVRFASFEQVVGSVAQTDLQQFSLVKSTAIRPAAMDLDHVEIKRNMPMNIVVRRGGLSVTLKNARARQNGRVGDTIEFVNPSTQRIIRAKIIDSTTAIIEM